MARSRHTTIARRKARMGRLFVLPFFLGFLFFFLQPLVQSFYYSFTQITPGDSGYDFVWTGMDNLKTLFQSDTKFLPALFSNLQSMLTDVPVILLFSLFIASILNQKFKGRLFARAAFFLPVLISSGIIINVMYEDVFNVGMRLGGTQSATMFQSSGLAELLEQSKVPAFVVNTLTGAISGIFDTLWDTGVQILIFLAAMQSVPTQLYEAARVEGATPWDSFWKITFPMISPMILVNVIYTIIDTFTNYMNPVMKLIQREGIVNMRYSYACAMGWVFLLVVIAIIGLVYLILSKFVVRQTGGR